MKNVLRVDKFNQMVKSKSNPHFINYIWIFDLKHGFVAYGTRVAKCFKTKKEAINSAENLYF